jgi:predicted nucleotidyltransferase
VIDAESVESRFNREEKRYLLSQQERERIIQNLKYRLIQCSETRFVYLHGSFLGELPYKDVDIAVFFDGKVPHNQQLDISLSLAAELSHQLELPVDIHSLNEASSAFRFQVTRGRLLFAKNEEEHFEFVENTWRDYLDFKSLLEANLMDMLSL